jgi:S-adenosylmethionine:tRNA ribosyltransferase-isomerase
MHISQFDFHLPDELIAQSPAPLRDQSRLMVIHRKERTFSHQVFSEIGRFLPTGAVLFRNNAKVLPARLRAERPTGGSVECLLLQPTGDILEWWCLVRPGRKLPVGSRFSRPGTFEAVVLEVAEDGRRRVRFHVIGQESFLEMVNRLGEMPLPPYIHREKQDKRAAEDRKRYQTVYADSSRQVAAAAPTAGLHFTPGLLEALSRDGFRFADLTLHVGLGTFQPIKTAEVEEHAIHHELYELPPSTRMLLHPPQPAPRVAIGTTAVRAIEDYLTRVPLAGPPPEEPFVAEAGIYIYPPRVFQGVDALVTNFHLPRSSLLCLVSAFLTPGEKEGVDWLRDLYAEAIRERYRFFSYGDAMLIL